MNWKNMLMDEIEDISVRKEIPPHKAFLYLYLKGSEDLSDEQIEDVICVDKSRDGGCDGVYIDNDLRLIKIFQSKYTAHFGEDAFNKDELLKIAKVAEYLQNISDYNRFRQYINLTLKEKLDKAYRYLSEHGFKLKFVFVTNHKNNPNKGVYEDSDVDLEILSSNDLKNKFERWMHGHSPELGLIRLPYVSILNGPNEPKSCIINIKSSELKKIYLHYKTKLFSANVRVFQGGETRPNKGIKETLTKNPHNFWYFNNGITILAENIIDDESNKELSLKNPQIINGCQTTTQIGESPQSDATLFAKIISIKDEISNQDFIDGIIEANNRQNTMDERQLKSNHPLQRRLQLKVESLGYYYERKEKQYKEESKISRKIAELSRIDNRDLVRANLASDKESNLAIKDPENVLFSQRFDNVFREEKHPIEYIIPYLLWKKIVKIGNNYQVKNRHRFHKNCSYHIIKLFYVYNADLTNRIKLRKIFDKLNDSHFELNDRPIKEIFNIAYKKFEKSKWHGLDSGQRDFLSNSETYDSIKRALTNSLQRQIEKIFE